MEARLTSAALFAATILSLGAGYRTQNFIVTAPTPQLAKEMCQAAEAYRRNLSQEWLGKELPAWPAPCPITIQVGPHLGAGGATSFYFDRGQQPTGWEMVIQGSHERLLDSVLPHEITHTIFATHFGQPLPRWADEGACTTVEHSSEKTKHKQMLISFLTTNRGIAFNRMFAMKEYPRDIMPLYAQGYSLARFLIEQGGKKKFVNFVGNGLDTNNWTSAVYKQYGYTSLSQLQNTWLEWVRNGSGPLQKNNTMLAKNRKGPSKPSTHFQAAVSQARLVPVTPPITSRGVNTVATQATNNGWRSRNMSRIRPRADVLASTTTPAVAPPRTAPQSVSRPQPPGRPQQIILEWSRDQKQAAAPVVSKQATAPRSTASTRSYYAAPPQRSQTIRR